MKKFIIYLWILYIFNVNLCMGSNQSLRKKRHIIFPVGGGIFKLIVGFGIPTKLGIRQSMALGMNFQFQYKVPMDIAELQKPFPPIIAKSSRERRSSDAISTDRGLFYLGLEAAMSKHGLNGRACILRAICDNAMHPLKHEANGLFGELMHVALTPSTCSYPTRRSGDGSIYVEAQRAGEFGVDCESLYPKCPAGENLLDMLSVLDN